MQAALSRLRRQSRPSDGGAIEASWIIRQDLAGVRASRWQGRRSRTVSGHSSQAHADPLHAARPQSRRHQIWLVGIDGGQDREILDFAPRQASASWFPTAGVPSSSRDRHAQALGIYDTVTRRCPG